MCCTWQVECKEHHHILAHNHQHFLPGLAQHDPNGTRFYLQLIYSQMRHVSWSFPGCYLRYLAPTWLLGKLVALNRATSTLLE